LANKVLRLTEGKPKRLGIFKEKTDQKRIVEKTVIKIILIWFCLKSFGIGIVYV